MVTKRMVAIRDGESRWLETVLFEIKILLECYSRYVSHMIEIFILKIHNLKQIVDCNLARSFRRAI